MGFFKDMGNALNGNGRKRYDYTHGEVMSTLMNGGYDTLLYQGGNLTGEEKAVVFIFMTGYFDVITYKYEYTYHNNYDLDDAYIKSIGLTKLFFTDKLKWTQNYLQRTLNDVGTLNYQRPEVVKTLTDFGTAVGLNLHTEGGVAELLGHQDVSPENGYALLKEFFDGLSD